MNKRDRDIISDLERFHCLTRDQIIDLHFSHLKRPVSNANAVLLRLYRTGKIRRASEYKQYVYFPKNGSIRRDSVKLRHHLALVDVYLKMRRYGIVDTFITEPKYSKTLAEPDIFTIVKGAPLFIEVQLSRINDKEIADKVERYEALYRSGVIEREPWQPKNRKVFPPVVFVSNTRYAIESDIVQFIQVSDIRDIFPKQKEREPIKIKLA